MSTKKTFDFIGKCFNFVDATKLLNIIIMKNLFFTVSILSVIFLASCNEGANTGGTETIQEIDLTKIEKSTACQSLLLIAEDRSGSTTDHRKLTGDDYSKIISLFQEKANGQVAVRIIGNPAPEEREFFSFETEAAYIKFDVPEGAKMSEKSAIINKNKSIDAENGKIATDNNTKANEFVNTVITNKVIQYKPHKNKDITNIEDALHHIEMKVNEPTFKNYENIWVVIVSDGKHDSHKMKSGLSFTPKNDINLFLIGWLDEGVFEGLSSVDNFESVDGFISYFKTINCK